MGVPYIDTYESRGEYVYIHIYMRANIESK